MSEKEEKLNQMWQLFVTIVINLYKCKECEAPNYPAILAARLLKRLISSGFLNTLPESGKEYLDILVMIFVWFIKIDPEEMPTTAVSYNCVDPTRKRFSEKDFAIEFIEKYDGAKLGFICHVGEGSNHTRYFMKTHRFGRIKGVARPRKEIDGKQYYVHKLLHSIGLGPEPHFYEPYYTTSNALVETKNWHLITLPEIFPEKVHVKALLQLDLISRILCLTDCSNNPWNYGQMLEKPVIVDFRVEKGSRGFFKELLAEGFFEENAEFRYTETMALVLETPKEEKVKILRESLEEWQNFEKIDEVLRETRKELIEINCAFLIDEDGGLDVYVSDLKRTIEILKSI